MGAGMIEKIAAGLAFVAWMVAAFFATYRWLSKGIDTGIDAAFDQSGDKSTPWW